MEKFVNLPKEKQNRILDAALTVFGQNVYKKASTSDIAETAGISKGMVFHYFGSKKKLYLYLIKYSIDILTNEMKKSFNPDVTDFFDRIKMGTGIKMSVMRKHPAIFSFLTNMYHETDPEVINDIKNSFSGSKDIGENFVLNGVDFSRFKDGVDPKLLYKFLIWASEGAANGLVFGVDIDDIDVYIQELFQCLDFMKMNFYK